MSSRGRLYQTYHVHRWIKSCSTIILIAESKNADASFGRPLWWAKKSGCIRRQACNYTAAFWRSCHSTVREFHVFHAYEGRLFRVALMSRRTLNSAHLKMYILHTYMYMYRYQCSWSSSILMSPNIFPTLPRTMAMIELPCAALPMVLLRACKSGIVGHTCMITQIISRVHTVYIGSMWKRERSTRNVCTLLGIKIWRNYHIPVVEKFGIVPKQWWYLWEVLNQNIQLCPKLASLWQIGIV